MSPTAATEREWDIVPYQPGDETEILAMFNEEFGQHRSMEHWRWKFGTTPYGGPFISLARHRGDRRVVGNHVLMPFPLNVLGRQVLAGHSLDLVVRRPFWGQGIFETAGQHCIDDFRARGGRAVVAFPNGASYPGFVRSLGWNRILFPSLWTLRLDMGAALRRAGLGAAGALAGAPLNLVTSAKLAAARASLGRATRGLAYASSADRPADYDALWNACRSHEVVSLWKDATYLDWRYGRNPDHAFRYETLRDGDTLRAFAVSVERDGVLILCELLVPGRSVDVGRRLVYEVAARALSRGLRAIQFFGHDAGFYAEVFERFERRTAFENVFVGRSLAADDLDQRMANPTNWSVTYGDSDFV